VVRAFRAVFRRLPAWATACALAAGTLAAVVPANARPSHPARAKAADARNRKAAIQELTAAMKTENQAIDQNSGLEFARAIKTVERSKATLERARTAALGNHEAIEDIDSAIAADDAATTWLAEADKNTHFEREQKAARDELEKAYRHKEAAIAELELAVGTCADFAGKGNAGAFPYLTSLSFSCNIAVGPREFGVLDVKITTPGGYPVVQNTQYDSKTELDSHNCTGSLGNGGQPTGHSTNCVLGGANGTLVKGKHDWAINWYNTDQTGQKQPPSCDLVIDATVSLKLIDSNDGQVTGPRQLASVARHAVC
jgi:hypothetical protein